MDNLNFPLILVVATAVTGIVWLVDAIAFAPRRRASVHRDVADHEPIVVEYAKSFFPVLLIVLLLRSFVFEPFRIPSGSMIPTLLIGDFILVSKFSYGLRLPVVHTKILDTGSPERGDVAVFRFPNDPRQDYIKRVVGLPGDRIEYRDQSLWVNGEPVEVSDPGPYVSPISDALVAGETRYLEDLRGVSHEILLSDRPARPPRSAWTVPEGHYFMVGDNRDHSNDSRYWGFVPEGNLVGRATRIWMHWNGGILWSRLGDKIR